MGKNIWYMYHTYRPRMESTLDTVYGWCLSSVSWVGKRFLNFIKNSEKYSLLKGIILFIYISNTVK